MAQESNLQHFPTGFDYTLPAMESNPDWIFYTFLRKFFNKNKRWNFNHNESVLEFNVLLTKAIHKDVECTRKRLNAFRDKLQKVDLAFESLHPAYTYFAKYGEYAKNLLEKCFKWEEFPKYVESVNEWVKGYVKLMRRYQYFKTPLDWPKDCPHTEVISKPAKNMAHVAIENFQQAITLYDKLFEQWLEPDYLQIITWMNYSQCLLPFRKQFEAAQQWIFTFSEKPKAKHKAKIDSLKSIEDMDSYRAVVKKHNLRDIFQESVEAVNTALQRYLPMIERQHKDIVNVVLKVYDNTLEVLEPFQELANSHYAVPDDVDQYANQERLNATVAAERWVAALKNESKRISTSKFLTYYLQELPELYIYMAQFCFINCGDVPELEGFPPQNNVAQTSKTC